ncbi:MAG: glutathione transferase GstA [Aquirhabdus sp.]
MKLYHCPDTISLVTLIVLEASKLEFEFEIIASSDASVLRCKNGHDITDVLASIEYIAKLVPQIGLVPRSPIERHRLQSWLTFLSTEVYSNLVPLLKQAPSKALRTASIEALRPSLDILNSHLERNEFFIGADFTIADAYLFACVSLTEFVGLDLSEWNELIEYNEFVYSWPAVERALKREEADNHSNHSLLQIES